MFFDLSMFDIQWENKRSSICQIVQNIDLPILAMVEKWRKTQDEGSETGAVLTDLSRTFYYIYHNLLIVSLAISKLW